MSNKFVEKYQEKITETDDIYSLKLPLREKYLAINYILERSCYELTKEEALQFPSFFSRLVFLCQQYDISRKTQGQLLHLRHKTRFLQKNTSHILSKHELDIAIHYLKIFFGCIYLNRHPEDESEDTIVSSPTATLPSYLRVYVLSNNVEEHLMHCVPDQEGMEDIKVRYDLAAVNEVFTPVLEHVWEGAQLNLISPRQDQASGEVTAKAFVLEPDFLLDVSSLAECFPSFATNYLHYFRKKFEQSPQTHFILLGNLANFFLDELIYAEHCETLSFRDIFLKVFKQMPFEFTSCKEISQEDDFRAFMKKAEAHFEHIRRVVSSDFPRMGIHPRESTLEPSFFCEKYGVQGRLDMLQAAEDQHRLHHIVELKSGGLPYPASDHGRISANHEVQTIIYRMIIETVYGTDSRQVFPAILYSAADIPGTNLRMAAPSKMKEKEILHLRNQIVLMEHNLYADGEAGVLSYLRKWLDIANYPRAPKFLEEQLNAFKKIIEGITPLEKSYFTRFVSFISRELYILKAGDLGPDTRPGISDLWKSNFLQRQEKFELISDLSIHEISDYERGMVISFIKHTEQPFVNFREGDICVVYPRDKETDTVLNQQILKGTIERITSNHVRVRFRYKQRNASFFATHQRWVIEHDVMDHSYNQMYRNLFAFLQADKKKRELLLGMQAPQSSYPKEPSEDLSFEEKRDTVIEKAMAAEDYFLIVGPPGTGKTSVFARNLIERYFDNPDANILVLAYTNRAVDELCEAIKAAVGSPEAYIRIGSELSCGEAYRDRLLQNISAKSDSRQQLQQIITSTRIYVGTLAALSGRLEIFRMKKFQIALIDEASQILEPQIIGLLPLFDKFILIGDHKQLSTISLQEEVQSRVEQSQLHEIGLLNCRESLFERLFRLCRDNGWSNAYDTLTYQGRMHEELSGFVNAFFYDGMLRPASQWQLEPHRLSTCDTNNRLKRLLTTTRVAFIHTLKEYDLASSCKVNEQEAEMAAFLSKALVEVYRENDLPFDSSKTLGIIAPYRNQIALIKHKLEMTGIPELSGIMVDTVERFQGSQRDVIILSFCMNQTHQLQFFSNMNSERTVDRKLNVALTRARRQMFLIGNETVLRRNEIYGKLIDWAESFGSVM